MMKHSWIFRHTMNGISAVCFLSFAKNGFPEDTVTYIHIVQMAESMETLV